MPSVFSVSRWALKKAPYLVFNSEDDEGIEAGDIAEWGAFGFMFTLGVLSFADGRPRESSVIEYAEKDELSVSDFLERLRFRRGELHFYARRDAATDPGAPRCCGTL